MTARAYDRRLAGVSLEFVWDGATVVDTRTGSRWDWMTGRCVEGQYHGTCRKPLAVIPSFRKSWLALHPTTKVFD